MSELIYPPAARVAPILHERLRHRQEEARRQGRSSRATLPDAALIERLIEAAFWASLHREEGQTPRISFVVVPPDHAKNAMMFDRRISPTPQSLARLAPAVERPGIHLCVWGTDAELHVWGAARSVPDFSLVLEVFEPGLVVAKYSRGIPYAKFGNLAMFKGDRVKVVDEDAVRRPDCPEVLVALAGADGNARLEHPNVLLQLALSMRSHGHGGTLLVVSEDDEWRRSIVTPIRYGVSPPFSRLADMLRQARTERSLRRWLFDLGEAVDGIAGLTAVDGATILTKDYELLAFGAKIERARHAERVGNVVVTEPVVGSVPVPTETDALGGTRHFSAAQFVHDQRDALAFVASQDGSFTLFVWSDLDDRLYAHRIETLLL